jgi:hypothetical protein
VHILADGSLRFSLDRGTLAESAPRAWQEVAGERRPVAVAFAVSGDSQVGFRVASYDPGYPVVIDPTYTWHTFYGPRALESSTAIAVDGNGDIYVAGSSATAWQGDNDTDPRHAFGGVTDLVVVKLTGSGIYQWHTFYGSSSDHDYGSGIAVDRNGDVYVTGTSDATWQGDDDTDPRHAFGGATDLVVVKLTGSGAYQWHTFYGSSYFDRGSGIAIDGDSNLYVTGMSNISWQGDGNADPLHAFGVVVGPPLPGEGYPFSNIVVLKLNSSGTYQWHTFYGAFAPTAGAAIAVDGNANANVYVTGWSDYSWNGDGDARPVYPYSGGTDMVVLKLTDGGAYRWHGFYGSADGWDTASGIAVDGNSNVYVTGDSEAPWKGKKSIDPLHPFTGPADCPVGTGADCVNIVVLKLDSLGAYQWHTFYGAIVNIFSGGIAADRAGNVLVTGGSYATWQGDNGADPLHAFSGETYYSDLTLLRLNTSGAYRWHTFYGTGDYDGGHGIVVDGSGNIYVSGYSAAPWLGDNGADPLHAHSVGGADNDDIVVLKLVKSPSASTLVMAAPEPSSCGQPVTFTALVTASLAVTPSGTVTFTEGATPLGSSTLNAAGAAVFRTSTLTIGTHTITAEYGGDSDFLGSTSGVLTHEVTCRFYLPHILRQ